MAITVFRLLSAVDVCYLILYGDVLAKSDPTGMGRTVSGSCHNSPDFVTIVASSFKLHLSLLACTVVQCNAEDDFAFLR
jgi:hypothetical protein